MRIPNPTLRVLPFVLLGLFLINSGISSHNVRLNQAYDIVHAQTRERTVVNTPNSPLEVIKTDVDLVTVDALVLQKNSARVVGDLKREDFLISEDGKPQEITHFSQGSLPLSVLLLIDRGGCLDPFNTQVRLAAADALVRLKPTDEVAVMTYQNTADLLQPFTRDRWPINFALDHIPPHDEAADHCLNKAFYEAATYMEQAAQSITNIEKRSWEGGKRLNQAATLKARLGRGLAPFPTALSMFVIDGTACPLPNRSFNVGA